MKPTLKYIFITLFALLVVGYAVFAMCYFSGRNKEAVCRKLNIVLADGDKIQLITQTNIAQILDQNDLNPIGKTIKYIRTESIEDILRKNPMVKTAECYKTPSGIVHVQVAQRCPKFRIVGFESYYVDADRKWMPISTSYAAYVPVVSGRITKTMACGKIFDFVTFLEENPFWNAQIEQIVFRDDLKIELVPRVGEAIIILGTLDNYRVKLEKLRKLYTYGFSVIGWNRYETIDLQYKDQVVCTKIGAKSVQTKAVVVNTNDSIIVSKL